MDAIKKLPNKPLMLFYVGFALYCTWSQSVSVSLSIAVGYFGSAGQSVWLASNFVTLVFCIVSRIFYARIDELLNRAVMPVAFAISAISGVVSAMLGIAIQNYALCIAASVITSFANGAMILQWAQGFAWLRSDAHCKAVTFGAVIFSTFAYQILLVASVPVLLTVTGLAGAASMVVFSSIRQMNAPDGRARALPMGKKSARVSAEDPLKGKVVLIIFIFTASVPMNFLISMAGDGAFDMRVVMACTSVVVLSVAALEILAYRFRTTFVPLFVMIFFTGAMVLMLQPAAGLGTAFAVSSYSGFYLFLPMIYYELGGLVLSSKGSPTKIFSSGLLANSLGVAAGLILAVLVSLAGKDAAVLTALFVLYGVVGLSFVFLPNSAYRLFTAKTPSEIEKEGPLFSIAVEQGCDSLVHRFGLTPRERDVALLLVRSKSLVTIAETYRLSLNTVKTHVAHIYVKCQVNSREEFVEVFERVLDEG